MRQWHLILTVPVTAILMSGCVTVVALSHSNLATPAYCYDCHINPLWTATYSQCGYYVIRVSGDSYFYRPRADKQARIVHKYYDRDVVSKRRTEHQEFIKAHDDKNKQEKDVNYDGSRKKSLSFK